MIYFNRLRYKGTTPVIASSLASNPKVMFDGIDCVSIENVEPTPSYTQVTEVKMTNPSNQSLATNPVFFNTGVVVPYNQKIYCEAVFTHYATNYGCNLGLNDHVSGMPSLFYRFFTPYGSCMWDYYDGRLEFDIGIQEGTTYEIHFGSTPQNVGFVDIGEYGDTLSREIDEISFGSYNWPSDGNKFLVCITAIGIRSCKLYEDSSKTNLLFDGIPVLDGNNVPCMYDRVSNQFLYLQNPDETDEYGTITYIE